MMQTYFHIRVKAKTSVQHLSRNIYSKIDKCRLRYNVLAAVFIIFTIVFATLIVPTFSLLLSSATINYSGIIATSSQVSPIFNSTWDNSKGTDLTDGGKWAGYYTSGSNDNVHVVTTPTYSSAYALQSYCPAGYSNRGIYANLPSNGKVYVDLDWSPTTALPSYGYEYFLVLFNNYPTSYISVAINSLGQVFFQDSTGNGPICSLNVTKDSWYHLILEYSALPSIINLYLNSTQNAPIGTYATSDADNITALAVCASTSGASAVGVSSTFDNVYVYTSDPYAVENVIATTVGNVGFVANQLCNFSATWDAFDIYGNPVALSDWVFGWNGTGVVTNSSITSFANGHLSSIIQTLPTSGTVLYQFYAKDVKGVWNNTNWQSFRIFVPNPSAQPMSLTVWGDKMILTQTGQQIVLHGVNTGSFTDAVGGFWDGSDINSYAQWVSDQAVIKAQLNAIQSDGYNCIRVLTYAGAWIADSADAIPIYESLASLCAARGIYVIYEGYNILGINEGQIALPYPPYLSTLADLQVIGSQQEYISYMTSEAQTLKAYPNVIFGLWNEPNPANTTDEAIWLSVAQRSITAM